MPSVVGLLEERERGARERVEALREEVDRVRAELRDAELFWERFVTAREVLAEVVAGPVGGGLEEVAAATAAPVSGDGAVPGAIVPVWSEGLGVSVLSPAYQRIMGILAGSGAALVCREIASELGLEPVPAKVEGVRSKSNRLADRGWLVKEGSGRFTLAPGLRGGGS
ncbi:hypothetical protein [Streptomyces meridianus]|uniref:Uncharacterized protein n=1 Tax=Streptomyces meridianus TaxID=2938945 RepID=A0ABT0XAQ3_9ACTN|nr:hypothetical protein [Streptomyces meridianus]MCM2579609.1 hypothetical protein [Streptomyces meridianus]